MALAGLGVAAAVSHGCWLNQRAAWETWSREHGSPTGEGQRLLCVLEETGEIHAMEYVLVGDLEAVSEDKTNVMEVRKQTDKTGSSTFPG